MISLRASILKELELDILSRISKGAGPALPGFSRQK